MQELIDRLVKEANVTPEQAKQSIETIAAFVKEKFPIIITTELLLTPLLSNFFFNTEILSINCL